MGTRDVTDDLRTTAVEDAVSIVAQIEGVRNALVEKQRELTKDGGIVVVGRDIGTVVLPRATLKLFLDASVQERARRRYLELQTCGSDYESVEREILRRDRLDTERVHSPLLPASDALRIDTEKITLEEVVNKILVKLGERPDNG